MLLYSRAALQALRSRRYTAICRPIYKRQLLTLAIESSCDDTSVAIVEKHGDKSNHTTLHFLEKVTADNRQYLGIHPLVSLDSHRENLAKLVNKALTYLPAAGGSEDSSISDKNDLAKTILVKPLRSGDGSTTTKEAAAAAHMMKVKPDFISITRGPGMRSNLSVGLDTAKGLAVAWQIPLVGVHHMQAHLLTPRLANSLQQKENESGGDTDNTTSGTPVGSSSSSNNNKGNKDTTSTPEFPFLSILVSGGHTLLVHSKSLVDHEILASTVDIAIGTALDKFARTIIPPSYLENAKTTMYGKLLEEFAFPSGPADYADYTAPANRKQEITNKDNNKWGWTLSMPYGERRTLAFSFVGVLSHAQAQIEQRQNGTTRSGNEEIGIGHEGGEIANYDPLPYEARVDLSRHFMRTCFEHLASRTVIVLKDLSTASMDKSKSKSTSTSTARQSGESPPPIKTLVVSGGVAANKYLLSLLRTFLDVRGFSQVEIVAPPQYLCTDNAAMIGWTGIEMFEAGWESDLKCRALRKWSLDSNIDGGGILGPSDWIKNAH